MTVYKFIHIITKCVAYNRFSRLSMAVCRSRFSWSYDACQ